jgi:tRNA U34 5-methylaminomethyl-2-thiouridine-forming methyltransferase MnmC
MAEIITTEDGSHTLYVPGMDEHYHSIHGAITESQHIFISNGFETCSENPVSILEIGFGTGLNAFLTALQSLKSGRRVHYTSAENNPLDKNITDTLNYHTLCGDNTKELFENIHSAPWNTDVVINSNFTLRKVLTDVTKNIPRGVFNLIYFDAFGPDKQPEMWTREVIERIAGATAEKGIFVTYSAKGDVKRNLKASGFIFTLLPGPPGKRQIIRAYKKEN